MNTQQINDLLSELIAKLEKMDEEGIYERLVEIDAVQYFKP